MKGRLLFALMFVFLLAMGISSLNDMQSAAASRPVEIRAAAYVSSLPIPAQEEVKAPALPERNVPPSTSCAYQPPRLPSAKSETPPLLQSFYRACYQAFHYSDRAG